MNMHKQDVHTEEPA